MSRLIVLDTNVLVSAAISPQGAPAKIVKLALEKKIILLTCPHIVEEYYEVFRREKFKKFKFPPPWLTVLLKQTLHNLENSTPWSLSGPDEDDLIFLALAKGHLLVTGNIQDFPIEIRQGVPVVTPADYLNIIGNL